MVAPFSDFACFSSSSLVMPIMPLRMAPVRLAPLRLALVRLAPLRSTPLELRYIFPLGMVAPMSELALFSCSWLTLVPARLAPLRFTRSRFASNKSVWCRSVLDKSSLSKLAFRSLGVVSECVKRRREGDDGRSCTLPVGS